MYVSPRGARRGLGHMRKDFHVEQYIRKCFYAREYGGNFLSPRYYVIMCPEATQLMRKHVSSRQYVIKVF